MITAATSSYLNLYLAATSPASFEKPCIGSKVGNGIGGGKGRMFKHGSSSAKGSPARLLSENRDGVEIK
jgi:hypothetical protein